MVSNMESQNVTGRRLLGRFSEKVHREKLAKGLRTFGQSISPEEAIEMCGLYERGTIINDVKIKLTPKFGSSIPTKFYFISNVLTENELDTMREIPKIMIRRGVPMYSSNPFHCEIGQMKLYLDSKTGQVHRCIIEDLYCHPDLYDRYRLDLRLDILLIDQGECLRNVFHKWIYDFSQRVSYLVDTEEGAKLAKLDLEDGYADNDKLYEAFRKFVENSNRGLFNVKICGFEDNSIYLVDIISPSGKSYLEKLRKTYHLKAKNSTSSILVAKNVSDLEKVRQMRPNALNSKRRTIEQSQNNNQHWPAETYRGAIDFFTMQIWRQCKNNNDAFNKKRLLKVAVLDWNDPHQLFVLPLDKNYSLGHKEFVKTISSMKCMKNVEELRETRLYEPGQFVIFKNVFGDEELGKWLRGVVVSMSCYNEHNLLIGQRKTLEEKRDNFKIVKRLVEDKKLLADDLIYRVRSVDYGCESRCSPTNMRNVSDLKEFKELGTWSLRCRLFGVHKFKDEDHFSRETIHVFDGWMREKILEEKSNTFHVIFRSFLTKGEHSFDKIQEISLFHRHDPLGLIMGDFNYLRPKQTRFECLNWHLVEKGLASPCKANETSNIQLEDHVMNVLVRHRKI